MNKIPAYPRVFLRKNKDEAVKRRHPWIFSGGISHTDEGIQDGDTVNVLDAGGNFLACGHYQKASIAVRILSFEPRTIDREFWLSSIQQAVALRQRTVLTPTNATNACRLVFAEGDGLPGLVIDKYNDAAVIQLHSAGMQRSAEAIAESLDQIFGNALKTIYIKSARHGEEGGKGLWFKGEDSGCAILENGCSYRVNWVTGQKTGFFLDQRDNRFLLGQYSDKKRILNAFSYTGGFSVAALKAGAAYADSVDSSAAAIELCKENVMMNGFDDSRHQAHCMDVADFLKQQQQAYDVIVLDPPAFAKHQDARHKAVMGYKSLNALAMKKIAAGGILFSFSCSQVVDTALFGHTVAAAAIESGRNIRVIHQLSQPADHPVSVYHPEGRYLKGLVLYIE